MLKNVLIQKFRILFKCLTFNITVKQQNYNIVDIYLVQLHREGGAGVQENPWTLAFDETEELLLPGERDQLN